jgi:hypothetical protein
MMQRMVIQMDDGQLQILAQLGEYPEVGGALCSKFALMPAPEIWIPAFEGRV